MSAGPDLTAAVALLGGAVVAVPLFRRLGLGSVLGYLAAGLAMGPFGLNVVSDPDTLLGVAELGVVLFLFIIGLEMEPRRLWAMRRDIFGLGMGQVVLGLALLSTLGLALGYPAGASLIAGAGFVLTSTAIVMAALTESRRLARPEGQRIVSILLFEDLSIVPLLALVAFLAPGGGEAITLAERLRGVALGLGAIALLVGVGRFALNPLFRRLAAFGGREVMTAGALLVVLGSALLMQAGGLSAAMGAFLAGVLLSESTFRHQLEADIEPFRGLLLGLFFLAVGMSLDLAVVAAEWRLVLLTVVAFAALKGAAVYGAARIFKAPHEEALWRAATMAHGGEFAFVLYASALATGLIDATASAVLTAVIVLSMMLMPLLGIAERRLAGRRAVASGPDEAGPDGSPTDVLLIGFGRFGQIASQPLLARGHRVAIIDTDNDMIRVASYMGFRVFFGDGTRLDILRAAGAEGARAILVAIDDPAAATRIVEIARAEFPDIPVLARAFDRAHALALVRAGADWQVRETVESALDMGREALERLGEGENSVIDAIEDVRARDRDRLAAQMTGDLASGRDLLLSNLPDDQRDALRAAAPPRGGAAAVARAGDPVAESG